MSIRKVVVASVFSLMPIGSLLLGSAAWSNEGTGIAAQKAGQCEPRVVRAETQFPQTSQNRGEGGTVRVQVTLDKEGRVVGSHIAGSSGSVLLDRAAEKSVSSDWRFDVSHCIASALPVTQEVNVIYRPVPKSFSVSISRRGMAYVRQAKQDNQCTVVPVDSGSHVISCIQHATAGSIAEPGLAQRDAR